MTDEQREAILAEARRHVAMRDTDVFTHGDPSAEEKPPARDYLAEALARPLEDPLEKWRKFHAERDAARKAAKAEFKEQERQILAERQIEVATQWHALDAKMEGHIERERTFMIDVIGCTLAEERELWREELAKLEARIEARIEALEGAPRR